MARLVSHLPLTHLAATYAETVRDSMLLTSESGDVQGSPADHV